MLYTIRLQKLCQLFLDLMVSFKKYLRRIMPNQATLFKNRFLKRFAPFLQHPNLWHINRRAIAGGAAVGIVGGMIPGPLQVITATLLALMCRVNLPMAVFTTFYTNPFTIGPLYWLAFKIGAWISGVAGRPHIPPMPSLQNLPLIEWAYAMYQWVLSLGMPLLIGLPILTAIMAFLSYFAVSLGWRIYIYRTIKKRYRRVQAMQQTQ
jgi:uncharacterized protein (DUF2062 family)